MSVSAAESTPDFQELFKSLPGLYLVLSPDLKILAATDAYLRAATTTRQEILGHSIWEAFPQKCDDPSANSVRNLRASLQRVLRDRVADTMPLQKYGVRRRTANRDGFEERYWRPINIPSFGPGGDLKYIIHGLEDVTDSVRLNERADRDGEPAHDDGGAATHPKDTAARVEGVHNARLERDAVVGDHETLRLASQEHETLFDLASDAIFVLDLSGRITSWNRGAEALYGYPRAEAIRCAHELLQTRFPESLEQVLHSARTKGEWRGELVHRTKAGVKVTVESRWTPRHDDSGKLIGTFEINRDITNEKKLLAQVQKYAVELEHRVTERTQQLQTFVYSMSHDLRAPLRGMQYFSSALAEDHAASLNDEGRDFLHRIITSGARMETLIDDLLVYSRLDSSEMALGPVSLDATMEDALQHLSVDIHAKQAKITVARSLGVVKANRPTLTLIFTNLLSNALKFVASGVNPEIDVRVERAGESIRLSVQDNGIGIAPEHKERIFEVFERRHGSETYPGTGMGLAIVQKALQRMGGAVHLKSSDSGAGSIFSIELPAAEQE